MKLQGGNTLEGFNVPEYFENSSISYNGVTEPSEFKFLYLAMVLVNNTIDASPPSMRILPLNIYFVEDITSTFLMDFKVDVFGCFNQSIIFLLSNWRTFGLSEFEILFAMVEELCHAVWQIPDGPEIENKVTEVFRQLDSNFSYHEIMEIMDTFRH